MANTFTGLKLQGSIGKFGKTELSDIEAFCVFRDGKVLSSTERGSLLLWDGNFIKCEVLGPERSLPHQGPVSVIQMELESNKVVTAGHDGYIRWWSLCELEAADAMQDDTVAIIKPLREILVGEKVSISGLLRGLDHYIVQDKHGALYQVKEASGDIVCLQKFHSGKVNGLDVAPIHHLAATAGADGWICCWDYVQCRLLYSRTHDVAATSLCWAPATVDTSGRIIAAGFADGVLRILSRGSSEWILLQATKPHSSAITCICYSPDGRHIATGGVDGTVFILIVPEQGNSSENNEYLPLGFVAVPSGVNSLCWNSDSKRLLVAGNDGIVSEFQIPEARYNVEVESFELSVSLRTFNFKRKRMRTLDELNALTNDPDELDRLVKGQNSDDGSNYGVVFEKEVESDSFQALSATYSVDKPDSFLVTFSAPHSGSIFECQWDSPYPTDIYTDSKSDVAFVGYSQSKNLICSGSSNGEIRLRVSKKPHAFSRLNMHDSTKGCPTLVRVSYDNKFFLSVSGDGLLVIGRLHLPNLTAAAHKIEDAFASKKAETISSAQLSFSKANALAQKAIAEAEAREKAGEGGGVISTENPWLAAAKAAMAVEMTALRKDVVEESGDGYIRSIAPGIDDEVFEAGPVCDLGNDVVHIESANDIAGDKIYSIQDAKLKLEEDIRNQAAELKKDEARNVIRDIRLEFEELYKTNQAEIPGHQLSDEEFDVDIDYTSVLRCTGTRQCEEVQLEMEYDREKSIMAVAKLKKKFLENVAVELITVAAFKFDMKVQSFRCPLLSVDLQERLRMAHDVIASMGEELSQLSGKPDNGSHTNHDNDRLSDANFSARKSLDGLSNDGRRTPEGHGFEARKIMRKKRKEDMTNLQSRKPGEDTDDPRDIQAIMNAQANMGDYKLKTGLSYVVPESERVNTEKKIYQMVMLQEHIHTVKLTYNRRLLDLRDLKSQIIIEVSGDNRRLEEISKQLGDSWEPSFKPSIDMSEWPEQREDISDIVLSDYVSRYDENIQNLPRCDAVSESSGSTLEGGQTNTSSLRVLGPILDKTVDSPSQVEQKGQNINIIILRQEKKRLESKIQQTIDAFDEAVHSLRMDKMEHDVEMKICEMRLLSLYQEFVLLQAFEERDNLLASKLDKYKREKDSIVSEYSDCLEQLKNKKGDVELWREAEKNLSTDFNNVVDESSPFYGALYKCYRRKIKRNKKLSSGLSNDAEDFDESDESDDDYDDEDDYDEDDDEAIEDTCPPGCQQALFDKVVELRGKRLDHEDLLGEINKSIEDLKKTSERLNQKQRQVDKELYQTETEIQVFQTEKQRRFNEIDSLININLQRIACLVPPGPESENCDAVELLNLPQDLTQCLMFRKSTLEQLRKRIGELSDENNSLRQLFKDLHKEQSKLQKDNKLKQETITASNKKCEDLQMLKFGRLIDIGALDKASVSKNVAGLKKKVEHEEIKNDRELRSFKDQNQKLKLDMLHATEKNTTLLEQIAQQSQKQFKLEKELNETNVEASLADGTPQVRQEMEERNRLVQLVKLQANEVEALKAEINMLRYKGGHVYAPAAPSQSQIVAQENQDKIELS